MKRLTRPIVNTLLQFFSFSFMSCVSWWTVSSPVYLLRFPVFTPTPSSYLSLHCPSTWASVLPWLAPPHPFYCLSLLIISPPGSFMCGWIPRPATDRQPPSTEPPLGLSAFHIVNFTIILHLSPPHLTVKCLIYTLFLQSSILSFTGWTSCPFHFLPLPVCNREAACVAGDIPPHLSPLHLLPGFYPHFWQVYNHSLALIPT